MPTTDCARGCLIADEHVPEDGRAEHPEDCDGCAPRSAEVGRYCLRCALTLRDIIEALPGLIAALYAMPDGRLAPIDRKAGDTSRRATKVDQTSPSPTYDAADEAARWLNAWALAVADELGDAGPFIYRPDGIPSLVSRAEARYLTAHLAHVCAASYVLDLTAEARRLQYRLIRATGSDAGDRRLPTRCPVCAQRSLVRPNGTELIECRNRKCAAA